MVNTNGTTMYRRIYSIHGEKRELYCNITVKSKIYRTKVNM